MFLSIITPTYNRANLLVQCFNSLDKQTDLDFEWIIIDDGSEDNTKYVVKSLINECKNKFKITYIYKQNGGKHTALNKAFGIASGELTLILDSDDILTEDAVETIRYVWSKNKNINNLSILSFLRKSSNGKVIGDSFPEDNLISNHIEFITNKDIKGDKCEVIETKIIKEYRFSEFPGEKFIGESTMWTKLAKKYDTLYVNKPIYTTEYLDDGLTKSGRYLRIKSPLGGMELSNEYVSKDYKLKIRIKNSILYVTYGLFSKKGLRSIFNQSNNKILFLINFPVAGILYLYWKYKYL